MTIPDIIFDPTKPLIVNPTLGILGFLPDDWNRGQNSADLQIALNAKHGNTLGNDLAIPMPNLGIWVMFTCCGPQAENETYFIMTWPNNLETGLPDMNQTCDLNDINPWDVDDMPYPEVLALVHKTLWPWVQKLTQNQDILTTIKEKF